jgi:hypothetical protein
LRIPTETITKKMNKMAQEKTFCLPNFSAFRVDFPRARLRHFRLKQMDTRPWGRRQGREGRGGLDRARPFFFCKSVLIQNKARRGPVDQERAIGFYGAGAWTGTII